MRSRARLPLALLVLASVSPARADNPFDDLFHTLHEATQSAAALSAKVMTDMMGVKPPPAPPPAASPHPTTRFQITRDMFDRILADPRAYVGQVRPLPAFRGMRIVGIRLDGVDPQTVLGQLGLRDGDILVAVNGHALDGFKEAIDAYHALEAANVLAAEVLRGDQTVTIEVTITATR